VHQGSSVAVYKLYGALKVLAYVNVGPVLQLHVQIAADHLLRFLGQRVKLYGEYRANFMLFEEGGVARLLLATYKQIREDANAVALPNSANS